MTQAVSGNLAGDPRCDNPRSLPRCYLGTGPDGRDQTRVIGWPQAGRGPIGRLIPDLTDGSGVNVAAREHEIDTKAQCRFGVVMIGRLTAAVAGFVRMEL